jgi:hypothetical protein
MTELIGIAAVAIVAWFAAGTIWNIRTGRELMRWMQDGLPAIGERTTVRWLGSTAVELVIDQGKAQFSRATVVIFLEPRDLPWWPLSRLRGRRDTLIVRGVLKNAPAVEFEALDPASWSGRDALSRVPADWQSVDQGLKLFFPESFDKAKAMLGAASTLAVRRLSVRRAEPHFQLHVDLPDRRRPSREFFGMVCALAKAAG